MALDIKQRLRERGLLQKEAAAALNVSQPTMSEWASALRRGLHTRVPAEQAKPLAKLLGLKPGDIRPDLFASGRLS